MGRPRGAGFVRSWTALRLKLPQEGPRGNRGVVDSIEIVGGNRLVGSVPVSGAKNAALPILTAALLADGEHVFRNVPNLRDVHTMTRLLQRLGAQAEVAAGRVRVTLSGPIEPTFHNTGLDGDSRDADRFRAPTLRNIAETGPYMHDGSIETLEEVVKIMTKHQLGKTVTDAQVADMVAFMKLLTGKLPVDYIKEPALPGMS